jgi:hypothetical protein
MVAVFWDGKFLYLFWAQLKRRACEGCPSHY